MKDGRNAITLRATPECAKLIVCFILLTLIVLPQFSWAAPASLTYQGRILKSDGTPLEYNNVSFIFQITNPSGLCVIYQEQLSSINMVNSGGVFDVPIGKGTIQYPLGGASTILDAFNNTSTFTCGSCSSSNGTYTCSNGSSTYTASSGDVRKLRVAFYDGSGWKTITPDNEIRSVPFAGYALSAEKLGTNIASDFLLKAGLPTCGAGTFLSYDGTNLTCVPVAGASGGTVTNVTSANSYLTVINNTSTPTLIVNVGTAAGTLAAGNDSRMSDARTPTGAAGGVLSGSYPSPGLADSSVTTTKINDGAVSTSKLFANPGVNRLVSTDSTTGATLAPLTCTSGQLLTWSVATGWQCSNQSSLAVGSATTATTATNFSGSLVGDVSGTQGVTSVDKIKGVPLDFSVAPTNGQVLKFNGTNWAPAVDGSGGTITALTSDVSASGSGSVAATVNSVGGSTAANIHSAELASNAATNANTVSTIVKRDASGNFSAGTISANLTGNVTGSASLNVLKAGDTMTGNLTFSSNKGNIFTDSGTNTVTVQAPTTVSTSYVLKLPTSVASSAGQVLTSDTSGNLSWTTPSTTASSYSGVLPIANGGTNSSTALNNNRIMVSSGNAIVEAAALTNGQLLIGSTGAAPVAASLTAGSGITITPAVGAITIATTGLQASSLADGKIWVGQSGTPTAVTPSGDAMMTNAGAITVTGLRGKTVSATAPTSAGQVLRYDGTSTYVPAFLGLADIKASITPFGGAFASAGCTASQSLYWQSSTDTFQCQNVAIGDSAITYTSKTANTFLAAPDGSAGAPTFRGIASADLPSISSGLSGTLPVANGGTGTTTGSITGTSALTFAAGGTNQNVTLTPSGTGYTILNGNVGIGTTSPTQALDIVGSLKLRNGANSATIAAPVSGGALTYTLPTSVGTSGQVLATNGAGTLSWQNNGVGGSSQWTTTGSDIYFNTGNVGIGTSSPSTKLDVLESGSTNIPATLKRGTQGSDSSMVTAFGTPYLRIGGQEFKTNSIQTIGFGYESGTIQPAEIGFQTTSTAGYTLGDIVFANRNGTTNVAPAEVMRITSGGSVGIGTTSPTANLEISSASSTGVNINTSNSASQSYLSFELNDTLSSRWELGMSGTSNGDAGNMYFHQGAHGRVMTLTPSGNVGIGTTAPGYKLDIQGGGVNASGGYTQTSDIRLKTNIEYLLSNETLGKISQLRGIRYDWKDQAKNGSDRQIGLIAQDVQKVFPEAVKTNSEGFLSVSYSNLVAPLIEAVKELYGRSSDQTRQIASVQAQTTQKADKTEIEALNFQIKTLKASAEKSEKENAALKARLERIEKMLISK